MRTKEKPGALITPFQATHLTAEQKALFRYAYHHPRRNKGRHGLRLTDGGVVVLSTVWYEIQVRGGHK